MSVKAIVVDMDGTFLNDNHDYNRKRFSRQYQELKKRGVYFIVASGRPYATLEPYFTEIKDEITFIAEGGAVMIHQGKELFIDAISPNDADQIVTGLRKASLNQFIISCKTKAYINDYNTNKKFIEEMKVFYKRIIPFEHIGMIDDEIIKITASTRLKGEEKKLKDLLLAMTGNFTAISGGFGYLDILNAGTGKARTLRKLQRIIQVQNDEILAFGDSENDKELLSGVTWSVAMSNAADEVKKIVRYTTLSNNQDGVLHEIDGFLSGEKYQDQ